MCYRSRCSSSLGTAGEQGIIKILDRPSAIRKHLADNAAAAYTAAPFLKRLADLLRQLADHREQLAGLRKQLADLRKQLAGLRKQLADSRKRLAGLWKLFADPLKLIAYPRKLLVDLRKRLADLRRQLAGLLKQLADHREQLAALTSRGGAHKKCNAELAKGNIKVFACITRTSGFRNIKKFLGEFT